VIEIATTRKSDTFVLAVVASFLSVSSFLHFYSQDKILLYGDAVAHINIARRVFDSQFPGLSQLGTVWLPLPHLLMLPFIVNEKLWSSGAGGSLVSMVTYVVGAIGVAKIFWTSGLFSANGTGSARLSGWIPAIVYALNPNLLYLQSTAMTEPLGLALMLWAIYFYFRFVAEQRAALLESIDEESAASHSAAGGKALLGCAVVLAAAMLTRYDYWFLAAIIAIAVVVELFVRHRRVGLVRYKQELRQRLRRKIWIFSLILATVPAFWLIYNQALFGNAMEFANGKYSARAIAARSAQQGNPPHPGAGNLKVAATYYWKAARLNVGSNRAGVAVVAIASAGIIVLAFAEPLLALLLISPFIFYSLSVALGGIPIFIPSWWPFSYYNVRYGLQLLPAAAIGCGYLICLVEKSWPKQAVRWAGAAVVLVVVASAYVVELRNDPVCLREAEINSAGRIALHKQLAAELKSLPPDSTFVVSLSEHVGAFERAGIPLRRTWNESSHRSGEQEFAFPLTRGDYVVAFDGDQVARMVAQHPEQVKVLAILHAAGEKRCVIYQVTRS
jgi:hypothetical protein